MHQHSGFSDARDARMQRMKYSVLLHKAQTFQPMRAEWNSGSGVALNCCDIRDIIVYHARVNNDGTSFLLRQRNRILPSYYYMCISRLED